MVNVRRLGTGAAAVAALALLATQLVSAAPAAKVGTSYWTTGSERVTANGLIIKSMNVPAAKYHVTATVLLENNIPGEAPGGYVNRIYCTLFAYGSDLSFAETSLEGGGYATVALDGVIDASRATPDAFIDVECRTFDATSPMPSAGVTIVADVMSGIVDLR
jgi:hypothetical protein